MASAVARAVVSSTSLHTTRPPRRASSTAKAAPMPLPAPVITAAALRLRFSVDPKMPTASPRLQVDVVVAERFCDEACDVPHRRRGLRREPGQRLEDVHLVRPDLEFAFAARSADVG